MRITFVSFLLYIIFTKCLSVERKNPWQFYKLGHLPEDHAHYHYDHHTHDDHKDHHGHHHSHTVHGNNVPHVNNGNDHKHHDHSHHDHHEDHAHYVNGRIYYHHGAHKAPPGYPSSDFVKYFAKYTTAGGNARHAPHNYYYDKHGKLHHFGIEPEFAEPKSLRAAHLRRVEAKPIHDADIYEHHRNFVAAGGGHYYRTDTGSVPSPSGEGPHQGYYYGTSKFQPKLYVGNRPFYY